jgi:Protein of unknown function (DUF559)
VEIDGGQHNFDAHARRDAQRDNHLAEEGFRILRFWNNEVDRNLEGVLTLIHDALRNPHPASLREATLPRERRGGGMGLDLQFNLSKSLCSGTSAATRANAAFPKQEG